MALARWGIDIVGPLPTAPGNYKYAAVAVKYFSKWVEAKALREVTVDNGKQFDSQHFKEFFHSVGTKLLFVSVYHPQSNGAVERANGIIFTAIKKCLFDQ